MATKFIKANMPKVDVAAEIESVDLNGSVLSDNFWERRRDRYRIGMYGRTDIKSPYTIERLVQTQQDRVYKVKHYTLKPKFVNLLHASSKSELELDLYSERYDDLE